MCGKKKRSIKTLKKLYIYPKAIGIKLLSPDMHCDLVEELMSLKKPPQIQDMDDDKKIYELCGQSVLISWEIYDYVYLTITINIR